MNNIYAGNTRQERFLSAIKSLELEFPVAELERQTGYDNSTISLYLRETGNASSKFIKKVCEVYSLNLEKILKGEAENDAESLRLKKATGDRDKRKVPILGDALAGTNEDMNMIPQTHYDYIDVGDLLSDSEAAFTVYGNSMTPNYPSGAVLGLKRNYDGFIQPGELYVLETRSNRVFKRLYYNHDKTAYVCYSDNTMAYETGPRKGTFYYEPFEIPLNSVIRLYDVTGMIKRTRNSGIINRMQ